MTEPHVSGPPSRDDPSPREPACAAPECATLPSVPGPIDLEPRHLTRESGLSVAWHGRCSPVRSMLLHEMVAPNRCRLAVGAVALASSLSTASRDAHACGSTPIEVHALLPLDGATNVPLNAVLVSSSNVTAAVFELHEVLGDSSDVDQRAIAEPVDAGMHLASDAGPSGAVALSVDCDAPGQGGGAVCLARPIEPLKPNTRYAWRTTVAVPDGYVPDYFEGLSREFTTGSALDDQPIAADAVRLAVTEDHQEGVNSCGISHWIDVAYSLRASEPAVLHFEDYTPSYVMHATLLAGD
jgi:hypothetical protein